MPSDPQNPFPISYAASRERFRAYLPSIQHFWPDARLVTYSIGTGDDLTQDIILADAVSSKEKAIIFHYRGARD